jgi:hypothetical protein
MRSRRRWWAHGRVRDTHGDSHRVVQVSPATAAVWLVDDRWVPVPHAVLERVVWLSRPTYLGTLDEVAAQEGVSQRDVMNAELRGEVELSRASDEFPWLVWSRTRDTT